jgi:hypothetical protein
LAWRTLAGFRGGMLSFPPIIDLATVLILSANAVSDKTPILHNSVSAECTIRRCVLSE